MLDPSTIKLQIDPLIESALREDITSEDISTKSVMPHKQMGEVDLIAKEDGIICGLSVFERVFFLLGFAGRSRYDLLSASGWPSEKDVAIA